MDGKIFQFDNAPHHVNISTFPHHFHNGSENSAVESSLSRAPEEAVSQVKGFRARVFRAAIGVSLQIR